MERGEAGEVVVNKRVALRIRTRAGGSTPYERAEMVAMRLNAHLMDGEDPADIRGGRQRGYAGVFWGENMVFMVDREQAELNRTTPYALARTWADQLRSAFGVRNTVSTEAKVPPKEEPVKKKTAKEQPTGSRGVQWKPEETYEDKIVPVISVGRGIRGGAARVNGPRSKVKQVQAVAQIEADFKDFLEIEIYVPVSTTRLKDDLGRVQGVGVTGLGDYRF